MAGARQADMSGAMMSILKKMDSMLENTNDIYQEQLFVLNSIDSIQKSSVVVELQTQTKLLQSIDTKLSAQVSGGGDMGNVKEFKEAFGDVAGVIEKLLKATKKLDDKKAEQIANFFNKLGESINKFVKEVDAVKAMALMVVIKGIAKGVFMYSLMMVVATPLLVLSLPGAFLFGLSIKLLFKSLGTLNPKNALAMQAVLGLAKGVVLYSLAMAAVTILLPVVIIGSLLFGLSIRLLLLAAGATGIKSLIAIKSVLGLAQGIMLYTLAMLAVTLLLPVVLIGSLMFGLSIRLLLKAAGTGVKGLVAMYAISQLAEGILTYVLAMLVVTLMMPVVLIGTLIFVGTLWLLNMGLNMIADTRTIIAMIVLFALSLVIMFLGLAISLFSEMVTWESMLKVGTTIAVLSLMAYIIGTNSIIIEAGAAVLVTLGFAFVEFCVGFLIFSEAAADLTWESIAIMGAVIAGMALIGTLLGIPAVAPFVEIGAAVLITLGAAFVVWSAGFLVFAQAIQMLEPDDPKIMGDAIKEIGWAMAAIGLVSPMALLGSAAMVVAGAALIPLTLGIGAFKLSGFTTEDADTLEYSLGKITSGFLGGEIPGGLLAGLKFAAQAAARAILVTAASVSMLAAGVALIPITASLVVFKAAKFSTTDADNLEYMLGSIVKSFGIVTDYKRQKEMGFYVNPWNLYVGIEALSGAGRVLAGLAGGVQAWANLEVTEWEVADGGTKDAKLVIKGKRQLKKEDFKLAAEGMASVISAISKPFAEVGRLEQGEKTGNPILDYVFSGNFVSAGVEALSKSGDTLVSLAQGVQAFAMMEITEYEVVDPHTKDAKLVPTGKRRMKDTEIVAAGENISKIINVVAKAFSEVGRMQAATEGPIWGQGNVSKGVAALAGVGDILTSITEGVIRMAHNEIPQFDLIGKGTKDAMLVPGTPLVLKDTDLLASGRNIGKILNVVANAFAKIGKGEDDSSGFWPWADGYVEDGVEALAGVGDTVSKIADAVIKFATGEIATFTLINGGTPEAKLVPGAPLKITSTMLKRAARTIGTVLNTVGMAVADFGKWAYENGKYISYGVEYLTSTNEVLVNAAAPLETWGKLVDVQKSMLNMLTYLNVLKNVYDPSKNKNISQSSWYFGQFATNAELLANNADVFSDVADNFDRVQKSMKLIQTHINGMDLKKLTMTDSMMRSIAALSKNPEAVAKMVSQSIEKSFEELIKALKELTAAQAPAASAPGLLEKAGNFISDPLGFKKDREDKANAKKPAAPSAKMPTQMDVRIMNVDDLATRIASKMPSDRRLKTNIKEIGKSKLGIKLYEFNYKHNLSKRYVGCMAQDLIGTEFEKALIIDTSGYYIVDYSYLDVECTEI